MAGGSKENVGASAKVMPPQAELVRLLDYNPDTGKLYFKAREVRCENDRLWNARHAKKEAFFSTSRTGYKTGKLNNRHYLAHRIIWKWSTGLEPEFIDHISGDKADNRLANLRSVSCAENNRNKALAKNNASGSCGVYLFVSDKGAQRWRARIVVDGRQRYLGSFRTRAEAEAARREAEARYGFTRRHGLAA